jgi:DNA-binding MarR family transcriptional regulator
MLEQENALNADAVGHLQILEALDGAGHVSQRRVAEAVGMAASRVNRIIKTLLADGQVRVVDESVRPFAYTLTAEGRAYMQRLSHDQYAAVFGRFREVQHRIRNRLRAVRTEGVERVILYGAGEVTTVVQRLAEELGLRVLGTVDDTRGGRGDYSAVEVILPRKIEVMRPDAVVITTFRHSPQIRARLEAHSGDVRVVEL